MVVDMGFVSEMTLTVACCFMLLYDALLYLKIIKRGKGLDDSRCSCVFHTYINFYIIDSEEFVCVLKLFITVCGE